MKILFGFVSRVLAITVFVALDEYIRLHVRQAIKNRFFDGSVSEEQERSSCCSPFYNLI